MFSSPSHFAAHHYGRPEDLGIIAGAAAVTRRAIDALDDGRVDLARRLWGSVPGEELLDMWNRWNAASRVIGPQWDATRPPAKGPKTGPPSWPLARYVFERDRWRCQYCDIDVFSRRPGGQIARLVGAFPDLAGGMRLDSGRLFGTGKSGAILNRDYPKVLWSMAAPDHVFPASLGGPTDRCNVVTACWGCNAWKDNRTLDQMGIAPLPTGRPDCP